MASYLNISVEQEQTEKDNSLLTPILTATRDLLHAAFYCNRDMMKYSSRLHANQFLARRDAYLSQSLFPERFNKVLRTLNVLAFN